MVDLVLFLTPEFVSFDGSLILADKNSLGSLADELWCGSFQCECKGAKSSSKPKGQTTMDKICNVFAFMCTITVLWL